MRFSLLLVCPLSRPLREDTISDLPQNSLVLSEAICKKGREWRRSIFTMEHYRNIRRFVFFLISGSSARFIVK
ncbi:hypothetical protein MTR_3g093760 [Medicago truncatula]|uniref:Uncharacterized protein n=1 Tax=Medicago truncatula TaxID=3880 RepID=A0A072V2E0_MEDTR|nr:hypothetical protein MTR_3g093760 [Medicago truncatula]